MKIYKYNISDISQNEVETWFKEMSEERQHEVARILNENKRISKIAADNLCRKAVSEFCCVAPSEIRFQKNRFGKPFAENLSVNFNISHSGDMVICAVSDKKIGIDIEKIRPYNPKAAEKFATEKELEYIRSNENGFFEIWTLKEAFFKCTGTGLGADIKTVSFEINSNGIQCSDSRFRCFFIDISGEYICSVCEE